MKIVFAFGTSKPLSIIVVDNRISNSLLMNSSIIFSNFFPSIFPCPIFMLAFGTKSLNQFPNSSILLTLL